MNGVGIRVADLTMNRVGLATINAS
jgi:hypothetical protein